MDKRFTKGNWVFGENYISNNGTHVVYSTNGSYPVQNTYIATTLSTFNSEANAKLIAAAPELLEALTELVTASDLSSNSPVVGNWNELINNAKEAIKKATE